MEAEERDLVLRLPCVYFIILFTLEPTLLRVHDLFHFVLYCEVLREACFDMSSINYSLIIFLTFDNDDGDINGDGGLQVHVVD